MSIRLKIVIGSEDVTAAIDLDSFPEWFSESMKGDGYFQFEVKPFVFRIIARQVSTIPSRGDWVYITNTITGKLLLKGKIDELADDESPLPEITLYPQALLLKDTVVGDEVELSSGETVNDLEFDIRHIRDTATDVLNRVNAIHGSSMYCNETSIPDAENTGKFVGDVLAKLKSEGFANAVLNFLGFTDKYIIRKATGGTYYLIEKIGGIESRIAIKAGALANVSLGTVLGHDFGRWKIPKNHFKLPTLTIKDKVWSMLSGGLQYIGEFDNADGYGTEFEGEAATNVPSSMVSNYVIEKGLKSDEEIIASFDYDERNSYALVTGRFKKDSNQSAVVVSFETTFDDEYSGHYRDSTAMEILRDLAVVANRWIYVNREGLVYMLPRSQSLGTVSYSANKTLEQTKKVRKEEDPNISLGRYEESEDGEVMTYGLKLRQSEVDNILSTYRNLFTGDVTERNLTMYNTVEDDILKTVSWDYKPDLNSIGTIIAIDHSLLEEKAKARIEDGV